MKGYPKWFTVGFVTAVALAVFVSGALLWPTAWVMRFGGELPWRLDGNTRILVAAAHAACAFLITGVLGALAGIHMRHGWRKKKNHRSGFAQLALWALLGLTALGLYYLANETWLRAVSLAHSALGLLVMASFAGHIYSAGRLRSRPR